MPLTSSRQRDRYTADHEAFRDSVVRFIASEVTPHLQQWRVDEAIPRELFAAAGAAGFLGTAVPEEFGGGGADGLGFTAVLIEELAAAGSVSLAWAFAVQAGLSTTLLTGSDCSRWLSGLASGDQLATVGSGKLDVSDQRLSGSMTSISGAGHADLLLVDLDGASVAVVEVDQPAVNVVPRAPALAAPEAGMADVILDGAEIAALIPRSVRPYVDLWFAVTARATATMAFRLGLEYVATRRVFGKPLATFENTRFRLAELSADISTTTAFVDSCVAAGIDLTPGDAAGARLVCSRLLDDVVDQCLQLHGGYGYMREYAISTAYADARFLRLAVQRFSDPRTALAEDIGL